MKYLPFVWAGLWRKPLRTTFTILALVVAFALFGLLQGINAGFNALRDAARADGLYVQSRYGTPMPIAYKAQIAQMAGVKSVTSMEFMGGIVNGDPKRQIGIAFAEDGFFDFFRWLVISPGKVAELRGNRTAVVVGKATADRVGLKAGDRFTIKSMPKKSGGTDWMLDVLAVVDRNDIPNAAGVVVGNFEYLNEERASGADMINQFMVLVNDADTAAATGKAIDDKYLNSTAPTRTVVDKLNTEQQFQDDSTHTMVNAIVLSTLFALLLMTSNSMMQSFRERIPELGTVKALGFSDRQVLGLVLAEAVIQCIIGAALGLAIARVLVPYTKKLLPGTGFMTVSWWVVGLGLLIAFLVALISAALPAWRAGRMEIVNALAAR
jgi:putative ABC transport system permease protein